MNKKALRADFLLLLTSCIWGFAFVAQRFGMEHLGPFTFNAIRFALGSVSLVPLILYRRRKALNRGQEERGRAGNGGPGGKAMLLSSLGAGAFLFMGASLQQIGIIYTTAGNAGFITGLYVVLVPIFGMFTGSRTGIPTWIGALFTLAGLYFLSGGGMDSINPGDALVAAGAVFWACHVLLIDRLVKTMDPLILSCGQFAWCSLFSLTAALLSESADIASVQAAIIPILYAGLCSVGIAYTLQVIAQRHAPAAHATIILCLEGVFAAIGGVIILREPLGPNTLTGFGLILCGMLATQWDVIAGGLKKKG